MNTPKRTLSRRAEAVALACLIACLGALGLHAATQITTFEPAAATVGNARLIELAITQYVQDSDEQLPPMHSAAEFQTLLRPYVPDPTVFVSRVTGKPFVPNSALSGKGILTFSAPDTVAVFGDGAAQPTIGFLDGHIERGGVVQGDPKTLSIANAQTLAIGVLQYEEVYDETYPPMKTQAEFKAAIYPFVQGQRFFIDPLNGKPFVPNPALSGVTLTSINDPRHTILLQSAMPYPSGVPTIAYTDGHVTPVLPGTETQQDASNLNDIGLATIQYAEDYDEKFPTTTDYVTFTNQLEPFIRTFDVFTSPGTGLPYILNPAISGVNIATIDDPSNTEVARDAQINPDGTLNHLELDGRVRQDFYFVPKSLVVAANDQTHLLWLAAHAQAALWTIQPGSITKYTQTLSNSNNPIAFGVGVDGQTRLLWSNGYQTGTFNFPITGAITLDTIGADGVRRNSTQFGPYDGWAARLLTTSADNSSRLLWQRYDGRLALWTLSPEGNFLSTVALPKREGGTPLGLALGTDGLVRLLWKTVNDTAKLWIVAEDGQVLNSFSIPHKPGYTVTGFSLTPDGASHLLLSNGQNKAVVQTLRVTGSFGSAVSVSLPNGGTASQLAIGSAGDLRILWEASDGSGQLQTLTGTGTQTGVQSLTPYQ